MSGLLIFLIGVGTLPFAMHMPFVAVLAYEWFQYLSPADIAWGPLLKQPYSMWFGACAILGWVFLEKKSASDINVLLVLVVLYLLWVNLTTLSALAPSRMVMVKWDRTVKIIIFSIIIALMLRSRMRIEAFVLIFVACMCFHSGMAAVKTVLGSAGKNLAGTSFVNDRNQLAVVMLMTLPLIMFLRQHMTLIPLQKWTSLGLLLAAIGVPLAAIGTQSRGALVAGAALGCFYFIKARRKGPVLLAMIATVVAVLILAPEEWFDRMRSIGEYSEESSASSRIDAWAFGIEIAVNNPLFGGGFRVFEGLHKLAAHSIFFEVLGEHGFIGFTLYMSLFALSYVKLGGIIRRTKPHADLLWASDLARALQILFFAYAVGGAFLAMAHYPMFFDFVAVTIGLTNLVNRELVGRETARAPANWRFGSGARGGGGNRDPVVAPAPAAARGIGSHAAAGVLSRKRQIARGPAR